MPVQRRGPASLDRRKERGIIPGTHGFRVVVRPCRTIRRYEAISSIVTRGIPQGPSTRRAPGHQGYSSFFRSVDAEAVAWIQDPKNVAATPEQFSSWLALAVQSAGPQSHFPQRFLKVQTMNFYVLAKPDADEPDNPHGPTDALWEEGFTSGEALRRPACNRFLSMLKWLPPYRVELTTWGKRVRRLRRCRA